MRIRLEPVPRLCGQLLDELAERIPPVIALRARSHIHWEPELPAKVIALALHLESARCRKLVRSVPAVTYLVPVARTGDVLREGQIVVSVEVEIVDPTGRETLPETFRMESEPMSQILLLSFVRDELYLETDTLGQRAHWRNSGFMVVW